MKHLILLLLFGIQLSFGLVSVKTSKNRQETQLYKVLKSGNFESINLGLIPISNIPGVGLSTTNVYVGSFNQKFDLKLDLSTSTTWLSGTSCKSKCEKFCDIQAICQISCSSECCTPQSGNPNYACVDKHLFNTTSSSFSDSRPGKTWEIDQGEQHTVKGSYGKDNFRFGSKADGLAQNAEFGVANELSLSFTQWTADGVLGLGKKQNGGDDTPPIAASLVSPLVQLALADCSTGTSSVCGLASFGKEVLNDNALCNKDNAVSFKTNTNQWGFQINEYTLGGETSKDTLQVALDIESDFVTLNDKLFEQMKNLTKATYDQNSGLYKVGCDVTFDWKMSANGKNYLVLNQDPFLSIITKEDGSTTSCYLNFQPKYKFDTSNVDIVFGLPLLGNYCQTFKVNDETVSFYELS